MISVFKNFSFRIIELIPLLLLFYISLSGNSVIHLNFFTVNIHYILIYYWVLKQPRTMGYGFIFLSGIITDVIFGLPIGATALSLLIVSAVAAYARAVTVRINLINDWLTFIPALLFANFVYFIVLHLLDFSIDYISLFKNSIFTFIFYPVLWVIFSILLRFMKS